MTKKLYGKDMNAPLTPIGRDAHSSLWVALFVLLGFFLSITQIFGVSPDYYNYTVFFDLVRAEHFDAFELSRFEPGFSSLVALLAYFFDSNIILYSLILSLAMLLKGWVLIKFSRGGLIFFVCAVVYLVRYFPLHEITQLRVACATSLTFLGLFLVLQGRIFLAVSAGLFASFFHISSILCFPLIFLVANKRWKVPLGGLAVYAGVYVAWSVVANYFADYILVLDAYKASGFSDVPPNPLAPHLLIDWLVILLSLTWWRRLTPLMRKIVLIEVIGMAFYYGAFGFGVFAHRIREFIAIFWIFYIADGLRYRATRAPVFCFASLSVIFYAYLYFMSGGLFGWDQ